MKWCYGKRPDDAFVVVILLDGCGGGPTHPDAVTSHNGEALLTLIVEDRRIHALAVLCAEQKDLPHFDALGEREGAFPARRGVAALRITEVSKLIYREITIPIRIHIMCVGLVGSNHKVSHAFDRVVGKNSHALELYRTGKAE